MGGEPDGRSIERMMRRDQVVGLPLGSAALCLELNCNTVFDQVESAQCPSCGSAASHPLAM